MRLAAFPKCYLQEICIDKSMSLFDWIRLAEPLRRHGVTGLELYDGTLASRDMAYLQTVRTAHSDAGFVIPMLCVSPDFTHPDPDFRAAQVETMKANLDLAATFGCTTCRVLSGQRRPEVSRSDGVGWVVECIKSLLPHAQQVGVILAIENHFKDNFWTYPEFAQRMDVFLEIVNQIESPWFGVNYDPSNTLLAGEDPLELLEAVKHRVVSMHASDRRPKPGVTLSAETLTDYTQLIHGEIGTGIINFDAIFASLRGVGFDGWVSIEDGVNGMAELVRSAIYLSGMLGLGAR